MDAALEQFPALMSYNNGWKLPPDTEAGVSGRVHRETRDVDGVA